MNSSIAGHFNEQILKYYCRVYCRVGNHSKKSFYFCKKEYSWLCEQCAQYSSNLVYQYFCDCGKYHCILHYRTAHSAVHSLCRVDNTKIMLYDIQSKCKKEVLLDKPFTPSADSISFEYRIFIIGGCPSSDVTLEAILSTHSLITKAPMLY